MKYLKKIVPPETTELLDCFDSTYVTGTYKKVGSGTNIKLRRVKALCPPVVWNVHKATLDGQHRTNNICESWNNTGSNV